MNRLTMTSALLLLAGLLVPVGLEAAPYCPDTNTSLLLLHIYEVGFKFWDTGYAAALTVVLLLLLATIALGQYLFLERRIHYR